MVRTVFISVGVEAFGFDIFAGLYLKRDNLSVVLYDKLHFGGVFVGRPVKKRQFIVSRHKFL